MLKKYIIAFLISMVPLIELRGALPYALASGLPTLRAYIVCIIGNMVPVPLIYFLAHGVLTWGMTKPVIGGFCRWCMERGNRAGQKLQSKAGAGLYVALMLFVSQFLGRTAIWTSIGVADATQFGHFVEESVELFGYALMLAWTAHHTWRILFCKKM